MASRAFDTFVTYKIISQLVTDWEDMPAFEHGIIDKKGKLLKKTSQLKTTDEKVYIAHLSIDLLIAIIATFWVILVFIVSGWVVGFIETLNQPIAMIKRYDHETDLLARTNQYANTVKDAIKNPTRNLQNIYFGIIMGLSAMIPTSIHFSMFCRAVLTKIGFFGSLKNINN